MGANEWVRVNREDGETVGWLEPLDPAYERLQPRDVLGHRVGEPTDWVEGEERLQRLGLAHLAEAWRLDGAQEELSILEVSAARVVLRNRLASKALVPSRDIEVPWPDTAGRLRLA